MTAIIHSFRKIETNIQSRIAGIAAVHPYAASIFTMFALPVLGLLAVFGLTVLVTLPFALLLGWL